jgi:hypothetical protein
MGSRFSYPSNACNYHCSVCMATGKVPNIAGRFHLINETQCKCNGCQTVFEKEIIYRPVVYSKAQYSTPTQVATIVPNE